MERDFLTVDQVAEKLQLTPGTVYSKIKSGIIPTHPWSDKPRIPKEALENWNEDDKSTFAERKLKQTIDQQNEEIRSLKNTIRNIVKTGLEVEL